MAELTDAQRKRQQARKKRRDDSDDADPQDGSEPQGGEPLEAVKQAAKVAAAGAAVGAAAAAARALTHHGDEPEQQDEPEQREEPGQPQENQSDGQPEDEQLEEPQAQRQENEQSDAEHEPQQEDEPEPEPVRGASLGDAGKAMRTARDQLQELLGKAVESTSGLERTHDGWIATLEVVEVSRIPETTDILASYELELDDGLGLRGYRQVKRYSRSEAGRDGQ